MLVLSRKINEGVVLSGGIVVRVLGFNGGRVRLGFEAPDDVLVMREEVVDRLDVGQDPAESEPRAPDTP